MKRFHVHLHVEDLGKSVVFYSKLFAAEPARLESDYAKWMLDDPRVNFAISERATRAPGVDHVGIQVDSRPELDELAHRLKAAGASTFDEEATTCCYAKSDKSWVNDPAGVRWETFYTFGDATTYGEDVTPQEAAACGASCAPEPKAQPEKATACCG
jgi:predicted lactoylglutathione lyase